MSAGDFVWFDVKDMGVEGKGWTETKSFYDRLPARAEGVVRGVVWDLSRMPTGMSARFETDAKEVRARWRLRSPGLSMPHFPATGHSGLDLYGRDDKGLWRWAGAGKQIVSQEIEDSLVAGMSGERRQFTVYLPLYNPVDRVQVGVPKGASLTAIAPRRERPIVFYGTSIVHGASASRPGMTHPAMLGRRLDKPIINLGFSGNAQMEPEVAKFLAELDAEVFVIDALPNMEGPLVKERAQPFVRTLCEAHPDTPIVLVEDRTYTNAWIRPDARRRHDMSRAALREAHERLSASGAKNLRYVEGETLFGTDSEASVDSSHPSDLGFMRMAEHLEPVLRGLMR